MNKILFIVVLFIMTLNCHAQHSIYYTYDASGNRITRTLRSQPSKSKAKQENMDEICISDRNIKVKLNAKDKLVDISILNWKENDHMNIALYSLDGKQLLSEKCETAHTTIPISAEYGKCIILTIRINGISSSWKIVLQD